jgi:hypothetical protein
MLTVKNVSKPGNKDTEEVFYDGLSRDVTNEYDMSAYEIEDNRNPEKVGVDISISLFILCDTK